MSFVNKADALVYATSTNQEISWDFNHDVFGAIDWTIPIETSLSELYRQRAQQLRDQYDYLSLFFSGGVDSTNILQTFISNNIFLDEIVMYRPARIINEANNTDTSCVNLYSEIQFAAIPYLQKYMQDTVTKIRFIDMDTAVENFFQDTDLPTYFANVHQYSAIQINKIAFNVTDQTWNDLYLRDITVCHILGQDKPRVHYENGKYSCDFFDDSVKTMYYANEAFSAKYSHVAKNQIYEMFYWTPDLPQLVIKQCQLIKAAAEQDEDAHARFFPNFSRSGKATNAEVMKIIYPNNVLEVRSLFTTGKQPRGLNAPQDLWFYRTMGSSIVGQVNDMIKCSTDNIADRFFKRDIIIPPPMPAPVFPKQSYASYFSTKYYF
jgi:hypothetical protein